jgi:hypothetical protein
VPSLAPDTHHAVLHTHTASDRGLARLYSGAQDAVEIPGRSCASMCSDSFMMDQAVRDSTFCSSWLSD